MRASCLLALAATLGVAALLRAAGDPAVAPEKKQAYGFRFLFTDNISPKEYLQKHPCVSGIWRLKGETETHWIGELHYPTGNVPPAYPTQSEEPVLTRRSS
jgi:hypothetical protein